MSQPLPLRDRLIPWYFVAAFALLIMVDGGMAYLAVHTNPGTVTDAPYQRGLAYNTYLAEAEKQATLGWKGHISYANDHLDFTLADKSGEKISGAKVVGAAVRPVSGGSDQQLVLTETVSGQYSTPLTLPLAGRWIIRIYATWNDQPYTISQIINQP